MSSDLESLSGVAFAEEPKEVKQFRSLQNKVIFKTKVDLGHFKVRVKIPAQVFQNAHEEKNHHRLCSAEITYCTELLRKQGNSEKSCSK